MMTLRAGALAGLLALATLPAGTAFADPVVLKFSADMPSTGVMYVGYITPWLKKVEQLSNGTVKFDMYPDGVLSKNGDTINRIAAGVADLGWDLPLTYGARFADLGVTALPGVYGANVGDAGAALWRAYQKGLIGKGLGADVKPLFFVATPQSSFFLKDAPKDLGGLDGLKIALASKERAKLVEIMGGTPLALRTAEYYQSISKGVADGAFSTVGSIYSYKVNELTKFYLYGPFGGGAVLVVMNKSKYDSLPPEAKKAIDDTTGEAGSRDISNYLAKSEENLMMQMLQDPKAKRVTIDDASLAKWDKAFKPLIADWLAATPNGQAILDGYKAEIEAAKQ